MDFMEETSQGDNRIGERLAGPNPQCKECRAYMTAEQNLADELVWACANCGCIYVLVPQTEEDVKR